MGNGRTFHELESTGWESPGVCASYDEHLSAVTTQSAIALLDAADVGSGTCVLDVATGAGYVAAAAAARGADAIGIDFSSTQVKMATERYPTVRFQQGNAEALPFSDERFDAVVNAFGMCHLPSPELALREAFRVLRHGGRIAFAVWDVPERAVALGAAYAAIRSHGCMDVGLPAGPNFFLFSDPEASRQALLGAGFSSPTTVQIPQVWRLPDPDRVYEVLSQGTVRMAATLRAQSSDAQDAIKAAMRTVVANYRRGDRYEVPMPAVLSAAIKQ